MFIYAIKNSEFNLLMSHRKRELGLSLILLFIISFFCHLDTDAQFYEHGQDAGSIKWNYFSSQHYQLIYPRGLDSLAMHFADKLEYFYQFQAKTLEHEHGKMPVVIHNEASFSNGVFVWAPKRLEIFTNPDPNGYPQDWLTQLAIHEGRHAVQVSKLNQGFSKALSVVGGEQVVGAITGFLPLWYLEGDAVDAETRFSATGRGRMPSFEMGMKALLLDKKRYSFSKSLFGSYKDYVPNHYQTGYLLVRYGRRTYGDKIWIDMEDYVARKPFTISPIFFSMKKYGVKSKGSFYNRALDEYSLHWSETRSKRKITVNQIRNEPGRDKFTNYHFPYWLSDSSFLVLKSGLDQIPEFITLDSEGKEKRVFRPGYMNTGKYSYSNPFLVWDEWVPDVRWSNRNYSVIRLYDMNSGEVKNLGTKTRYYAPSLSKKGDRIAAIEQRTDQTFHLVILDLDGKLIESIISPGNKFIQHPAWMEQDSAIILTLNDQKGEYLYRYSLQNERWTALYHSGSNDISHPVVSGSKVYFSGTFSGIDNIYCYDLEGENMFMVTSSEFGAFEPGISSSGLMISYSDYQAGGHNVVSASLDEDSFVLLKDMPERDEQLDYQSTDNEKMIIEGEQLVEPGIYTPKPYNKLLNSIHPHSWLPLYFDYLNPEAALSAEEIPVSPGFTLVSQNLLSTITGMIAYEYNDKLHYLHTGATLKGRVPIFDFSLDYGGYPDVYRIDETDSVSVRADRMLFSSSVYIPVRFNTGKYITFMQPGIGWTYSSDIFYNPDLTSYQSGNHRFNYRLYFTSYLRKGRRDILPRLGIMANAFYQHAPMDDHNLGSISSYTLNLYLPGFLRHQTFKFGFAKQIQDPKGYMYGNSIRMPRGIYGLSGLDMSVYSLDYTFPLLYPDLSIEPLIYVKRIRANLWCDYMLGKDMLTGDSNAPLEDKLHYSYGFDLLTDVHLLRMFFPVSLGGRFAYIPGTTEWKAELLFSIDVN